MSAYLIYETATGAPKSIASDLSLVANPLPAGLTAVELTNQDAIGLRDGTRRWDAATLSVVPTNKALLEANEAQIRTEVESARATNTTALGQLQAGLTALGTATTNCNTIIAAPITNVSQAAAQIDALAVELKRVIVVAEGAVTQLGAATTQLNKLGRLLLNQLDGTT